MHFLNFQELLENLNNDVQNVSAKAISNEVLSRNNQAEIAKLKTAAVASVAASSMNNPPKQQKKKP